MAAVRQTLYIKADQNVELSSKKVKLADVISMECADQSVISKLSTVNLFTIPGEGKERRSFRDYGTTCCNGLSLTLL